MKFFPDAHGTKNPRRKKESIYSADFWSVCHGPYAQNNRYSAIADAENPGLHAIELKLRI